MNYNGTILIVDDQLSAREVLKGVLAGQGYHLAFAASGYEALEQAETVAPDLILLDVMMPGLTGYEVCQQLRANPKLAEIPVVMVTALDDLDSLLQGIEADADDFISKPFNHAELRARVKSIMRLNRYRRLLLERAKFEWVVKKAGDGYLILDNHDNILYANTKARHFLGLPADEDTPISARFLELAGKQYQCQPEPAWENWPHPPNPISPRYLVRPETTSTNAFWLQVNVSELPSNAEGVWIAHLQDVTRQMDSQRNMWEFQALVSHKLRTPLFGMVTGLDLLKSEDVGKLMPGNLSELFTLVVESSSRLEQAVHDILQYISAPALAQPGLGFAVSQLQPLVEQISQNLGLKNIAVTGRVEPEAKISLSHQAVDLILTEILENAQKFHPRQKPKVDILLTGGPDNLLTIKISDDGLTLSPEQLARVWTPYYQGEKYFTGEIAGMGLGLSKVATLIWSVGGTCHLYNRASGPGVEVELTLPLANE